MRTGHRDHFFELSLDMLCIAGFDGYFKDLNPAWHKTLGFTTAELKARPFIDFVHPDDRDATNAETRKLMANIDTVTFEHRYLCKDRSYKRLLWNAVALPNEQVFYAVVRDVTEGKRAEEPTRQAEGDAEDAARRKRTAVDRMPTGDPAQETEPPVQEPQPTAAIDAEPEATPEAPSTFADLRHTDTPVQEPEPAPPIDAEPEPLPEAPSTFVDLPQTDTPVQEPEPAPPIDAEPEPLPGAPSTFVDLRHTDTPVLEPEPAPPIDAEPEPPPEAKSDEADVPQADSALGHAEQATRIEAAAGATQQTLTVLYIEDTLSNLSLIQRLFDRRPEVKIVSAMEGRAGLDMARELHPHLVLLDLHVSDMKGDDVLARLRTDPETNSIPVIVISTGGGPSEVKHLLGIGARDYLTKPFDAGKFFAAVDAALGEPKPDKA